MRSLYSYVIVITFLLVSAYPVLTSTNFDNPDDSKVSPRSDAVDFKALDIELGNSSGTPMQWIQPDSSVQEYLIKGTPIQINVTFIQLGFQPTQVTANATLQIWHPIGFMIKEWTFNVTLSSSQSERLSFVWTPDTAHSTLTQDGLLSGGMVIVGAVDAGLQDGNNGNDRVEREVPVAAWSDEWKMAIVAMKETKGNIVPTCRKVMEGQHGLEQAMSKMG